MNKYLGRILQVRKKLTKSTIEIEVLGILVFKNKNITFDSFSKKKIITTNVKIDLGIDSFLILELREELNTYKVISYESAFNLMLSSFKKSIKLKQHCQELTEELKILSLASNRREEELTKRTEELDRRFLKLATYEVDADNFFIEKAKYEREKKDFLNREKDLIEKEKKIDLAWDSLQKAQMELTLKEQKSSISISKKKMDSRFQELDAEEVYNFLSDVRRILTIFKTKNSFFLIDKLIEILDSSFKINLDELNNINIEDEKKEVLSLLKEVFDLGLLISKETKTLEILEIDKLNIDNDSNFSLEKYEELNEELNLDRKKLESLFRKFYSYFYMVLYKLNLFSYTDSYLLEEVREYLGTEKILLKEKLKQVDFESILNLIDEIQKKMSVP